MISGSVSGLLGRLGGMATGRMARDGVRDGVQAVPADRRTGITGRPASGDIATYRAILDDHLIAAATRTDAALSAATVVARSAPIGSGPIGSGARVSQADPAPTTPASP
jgi:hypothetical protein